MMGAVNITVGHGGVTFAHVAIDRWADECERGDECPRADTGNHVELGAGAGLRPAKQHPRGVCAVCTAARDDEDCFLGGKNSGSESSPCLSGDRQQLIGGQDAAARCLCLGVEPANGGPQFLRRAVFALELSESSAAVVVWPGAAENGRQQRKRQPSGDAPLDNLPEHSYSPTMPHFLRGIAWQANCRKPITSGAESASASAASSDRPFAVLCRAAGLP